MRWLKAWRILQPFFCLSYVTGFLLTSPGEPPMLTLLIPPPDRIIIYAPEVKTQWTNTGIWAQLQRHFKGWIIAPINISAHTQVTASRSIKFEIFIGAQPSKCFMWRKDKFNLRGSTYFQKTSWQKNLRSRTWSQHRIYIWLWASICRWIPQRKIQPLSS